MSAWGNQPLFIVLGNRMKRLIAFSFFLMFIVGCATEADQAQWDEALKDLRGDNMRMRTANWGKGDNDDTSSSSIGNSSHYRSGLN